MRTNLIEQKDRTQQARFTSDNCAIGDAYFASNLSLYFGWKYTGNTMVGRAASLVTGSL